MSKPAIITIAALILLAFGLAQRSRENHEYTTTSSKAFKLYLLGDEQLNAFQWQEAEQTLGEALAIDPDFAMAQATLAELFAYSGRSDEAKVAALRADSLAQLLSDENERMLVQLRLSRNGLLDPSPRDSVLALLMERLPDHRVVLASRALMADQMEGNNEEAERLWKELLEIEPNYARAYNWLGYLAAYRGQYDDAIKYLKKYAYLAPGLANPHDSLGEVLTWIGKYDKAAAEFRKALEIQPDFFFAVLHLGRVYMEQGMIEKGEGILKTLREEMAGTAFVDQINRLLTAMYLDQKLYDRAVPIFAERAERYKDSVWHLYFRAVIDLLEDRIPEAVKTHETFLAKIRQEESYPNSEHHQQMIGRLEHVIHAAVAWRDGRYEQEVQERKLVLVNSEYLSMHDRFGIYVRYGEALSRVGRHEEAIAQAKNILSINPRWPRALVLMTGALISLEDWEGASEANELLQAAMARSDPGLPLAAAADSLDQLLAGRLGS